MIFLPKNLLKVLPYIAYILIEFFQIPVHSVLYLELDLGQILRRDSLDWLARVGWRHVSAAGMQQQDVDYLHAVGLPVG